MEEGNKFSAKECAVSQGRSRDLLHTKRAATDQAIVPGIYNLRALTLMLAHCMVAVRAEPAVTCNLAAEAA